MPTEETPRQKKHASQPASSASSPESSARSVTRHPEEKDVHLVSPPRPTGRPVIGHPAHRKWPFVIAGERPVEAGPGRRGRALRRLVRMGRAERSLQRSAMRRPSLRLCGMRRTTRPRRLPMHPSTAPAATTIDEIADGIYRISTPLEAVPGGFTFNQFLVVNDEPLLFHTELRRI